MHSTISQESFCFYLVKTSKLYTVCINFMGFMILRMKTAYTSCIYKRRRSSTSYQLEQEITREGVWTEYLAFVE